MNKRSLSEWLQHMESVHPSVMDLGLERVAAVARELDLLNPGSPVITVAGTNGKGSTAAVAEALLLTAGKVTGTYTSPHFLCFNERIRISGAQASDQEIIAALEAIEAARAEISLTYFEFATLAALHVFRERGVDVIILEVGLGGRLDATNIVDPTVAVITSIALDHQAWLGTSLGEIAREKAGILRKDRPLVVADASPPGELLDSAAHIGAVPVLLNGRDFGKAKMPGEFGVQLRDRQGKSIHMPLPNAGGLLLENICAALQAVVLLDVDIREEQLQQALTGLQPVARRESRRIAELDYVLDVAHNPAAVTALLDMLRVRPCEGRTLAVFSAMADKDIPAMLKPAVSLFDAWFLAEQTDNPRAATASELAATLRDLGQSMISISNNLRLAFRRAQSQMMQGDRLVIFGSFYTVAGVLPLLEKDRQESLVGAVS